MKTDRAPKDLKPARFVAANDRLGVIKVFQRGANPSSHHMVTKAV
ncbi:hypothetical protein [Pseudarthrobacter sp. SSS035]|nr:hypothetical protein [Pseudarthrobacter sp. SSS035]